MAKTKKQTNTQIQTNKRTIRQRIKDALSVLINDAQRQYGGPIRQRIVQEGIPFKVCEDFPSYASEAYAGNPIVYGCIRLKANIASELVWKLYDKKPDGTRDEHKGDHRLKQILQRPNERTPWHQWLEEYITYADLAGVIPIHGAKPNNELNFLRPDLLEQKVGKNRQILGYEYTPDPSKPPIPIKPGEICYITLTNPLDEFDGVSPAEAAARSINLNNLARLWNTEKIKNTVGLGNVILTGDQPFTENQVEQVRDILEEQYRGPENAGKTAIVEGDDIKSLSDTVKDMDWLNVMDQSAADILKAFTVPAELMGESATFENQDYATRQFFSHVIFPMCDALKDALNHWLVPQYTDGKDNLEIDFDKENVAAMQEDMEILSQRVLALVQARIITVNEGREMLNLDVRDDCEVWEEPSNMLFSEATGEAPEAPAEEPAAPVTAQPVPPTPPIEMQQLQMMIGEIRRKYQSD